MNIRYNSLGALLKARFGTRVSKVALDSSLGCPHRGLDTTSSGCTFCHPKGLAPATDPTFASPPLPIEEQLAEGLTYIRRRHRGTERIIAAFQNGSNTAAPATILRPLFEAAIAHPAVVGLSISTRPDCVAEEHAALLATLAERTLLWVELGLQSAHDTTLQRIRRGHDAACFRRTHERLRKHGIPVCAHVILGLPGETPAMMEETARFLNRCGVWGVKLHNLHVLQETELAAQHAAGAVPLPSLEMYAEWVVDFLEILDPAIVVHRVSGHSPRRMTIAPGWSVNKLAVMNAVDAAFDRRDSRQGRRFVQKSFENGPMKSHT